MKHFAQLGEGKYNVWAEAIEAGEDLIVYIGGGEKPHIGGLSFSADRKTPFSISLPEHKDYLISSFASMRIALVLKRSCLVVVGIHIDGASAEDIEHVVSNSKACVECLIKSLKT